MNSQEEDVVDAREIDKVLSEVVGMAGRWSLFRKFLRGRLQVGVSMYMSTSHVYFLPCQENADDEGEEQEQDAEQIPQTPAASGRVPESDSEEPEALQAIEASASRQLMEDTLNTYYVPMEVWYMRTIIEKVCLGCEA